MENSYGRYCVSVELNGRRFSRSQGITGAPLDPTYVEKWRCETVYGRELVLTFYYGVEFVLDGKQIAYFEDPGPNVDGRNSRSKQQVRFCNLFYKYTGVSYKKVGKALQKALMEYRNDPMGCLEDYE